MNESLLDHDYIYLPILQSNTSTLQHHSFSENRHRGKTLQCIMQQFRPLSRMLSAERQYVAVLKGAQETFLPLLELPDTPAALRGKADALFPCWAGLSSFHAQYLLPAMEGALLQSLLQHDCFSKYVSERGASCTTGGVWMRDVKVKSESRENETWESRIKLLCNK